MEPAEPEWPWSPGITPAPPFPMEKLRPREVVPHAGLGSAVSRVWPGSGFSSPIKVAAGPLARRFRPHRGVLEAKQLVPPGPAQSQCPPLLASGLADSWRCRPALKAGSGLLHSHLSPGSLSSHSLPASLLTPGKPFTCEVKCMAEAKLPSRHCLPRLGQEGVKQRCLLGPDLQLVSWPFRPTRPSGLTDATRCSICPKAKSPGGGLCGPRGGCGPAVSP